MSKVKSRRALMRTSALVGTLYFTLTMGQAFAQDSAYTFDVPSEPLAQALHDVARVSGKQIIFTPDQVAGKTAPPLQGQYTADEALSRLFAGTNLVIDHSSTAGLMVQSKNVQAAQNEGAAPAINVETVVVTGTHIVGGGPIGANVSVITSNDLTSSGYGRIEDFFSTVPQNFGGNNETGGVNPQNGVAKNVNHGSEIQLRGLGPGSTLTLIDGQRQPTGGLLGLFVDVSMIPEAAIDRIEILPDGASAIYGTDAVGGVVNFILRKDFDGLETRLHAGTAGGSASEYKASQLFGTTWSTGNLMIGLQYVHRDPLRASDRSRSALNEDYVSLGGSDFRFFGGNPGEILNSSFGAAYAIPAGQDGTHLTVSQLNPNQVNYYDNVTNTWDLPKQDAESVFISGSQQLSSNVQLFGNGLYSWRQTQLLEGGNLRIFSVPSTNPFYINPFGGNGNVAVDYDLGSILGIEQSRGSDVALNTTLGLKVALPNEWELTATGMYGWERNTNDLANSTVFASARAAVNQTNPTTAFNVFGNGQSENSATVAALRVNQLDVASTTAWSSQLLLTGPVLPLPAGPVLFAIGGEYRGEGLTTSTNTPVLSTSDYREIAGLFGELAIPLIGPGSESANKPQLEVSLAGRYEHYSDFGDTANPKVGVSVRPLDGVTLRGTWGTSFRAPPFLYINSAFSPSSSFARIIPDPKSPTGTSNVLFVAGNNPNLQPETATVWTAGGDWQPISGVKLSATYFNIDFRNMFGGLQNTTTVLTQENIWASVINRNPSAAQISAICTSPSFSGNCTGPISAIVDARQQNLAVVKENGLDFDVAGSHPTDTGQVSLDVNGTYTFGYNQAVTASAPALSLLNTVDYPVAIRLRAALSWTFNEWTVGAAENFTGSYNNPGTVPDHVKSYATTDVHLSVKPQINEGPMADAQIFFSINNLFNAQPPFVNQAIGYDPTNGSLLGRFVSIDLVKKW